MENENEDFDYFNSCYIAKNFNEAAKVMSVMIHIGYTDIKQSNDVVKKEISTFLSELHRNDFSFSNSSYMNTVCIIGQGLQDGLVLEVSALLN